MRIMPRQRKARGTVTGTALRTGFRLDLDLVLHFVPPMDEHGPGIVLTRVLELPFPPYSGLVIHSRQMDSMPEPLGFHLKDVVWDMDRKTFLAETFFSCHGSFFTIADDIRGWLDLGWRLGSYRDAYAEPTLSEEQEGGDECIEAGDGEWEMMEQWPTMRARKRPADFNKLFRAVIRTLVEIRNGESTAYAMAKTQLLFDDARTPMDQSSAERKFHAAKDEFLKMSSEDQQAWAERIKRTYPRLERLVADL